MKHIYLSAIAATAFLIGGCSKESSSTNVETQVPSVQSTQTASISTTTTIANAVSAATNAVTNAVAQATAAATNVPAVTAVTNVATTNAPVPASGIQATLERAQALLAQQKYTEAATTLASLKGQNLSSEQQSLWQKLQSEVQKAMATKTTSDGAKALGGLLGK